MTLWPAIMGNMIASGQEMTKPSSGLDKAGTFVTTKNFLGEIPEEMRLHEILFGIIIRDKYIHNYENKQIVE